jgi:hypothetical protein
MLNFFALALLQAATIFAGNTQQPLSKATHQTEQPVPATALGGSGGWAGDIAAAGGSGGWAGDIAAAGGSGGWAGDIA